jgi:hypothetical protein
MQEAPPRTVGNPSGTLERAGARKRQAGRAIGGRQPDCSHCPRPAYLSVGPPVERRSNDSARRRVRPGVRRRAPCAAGSGLAGRARPPLSALRRALAGGDEMRAVRAKQEPAAARSTRLPVLNLDGPVRRGGRSSSAVLRYRSESVACGPERQCRGALPLSRRQQSRRTYRPSTASRLPSRAKFVTYRTRGRRDGVGSRRSADSTVLGSDGPGSHGWGG